MFRHVACCHLDLAQLWRCPVSWCTAWKGTPQDLMDHVCNAHNVPERVQDIRLETLVPPWMVTRQVYTESLTSRHSGISNDVLLFSDIGLSLVHHYRVHKRGIPHVAFRRNYMSQLRALLPLPAVMPIEGGSPDPACSTMIKSPDVVCASPRPSRCALAGGQLGSWRCPYGLPPSHITGPTRHDRGCGAGLPSSSTAGGDGCYRYGSGRDSVHV